MHAHPILIERPVAQAPKGALMPAGASLSDHARLPMIQNRRDTETGWH